MAFYKKLKDLGLRNVIERTTYTSQYLKGSQKVYSFLDDILENRRKVLLYGDYDADGLTTILGWKEVFNLLIFKNYDIFKYGNRTHLLDDNAVKMAIEGRYDYIIVNDTASNEMDKLKKLNRYGVKVILIDHHQTKYNYEDYPENCAVVNNVIENRILGKQKYILSAGALVYVTLEPYMNSKGYDTRRMACYALVSLYADCIDMSCEINRGIYYQAMQLKYEGLPEYISHFMNEYSEFTRRFIEFQWTPKMNSVFRSERFDLLNEYMLTTKPSNALSRSEKADIIEQLTKVNRELVDKVTDIIEFELLDNFIVGNLSSVGEYFDVGALKLYNYTGLVANRLANRYGKSAIVYCNTGKSIKGSFRDSLSRDYLSLFQQFCKSAGHNSAFGIHISPFGFIEWLDYIRRIDKKFYIEAIPNRPIIVEHEEDEPDMRLLNDMAIYNEFSGSVIPIAIITKRFTGIIREYNSPYGGYRYKWGNVTIESQTRLQVGSMIQCKPGLGKRIKLYVV